MIKVFFATNRYLKAHVYGRGQRPRNIIELQEKLTQVLANVPPEMIIKWKNGYADKLQKCIAAGGGHFEKENIEINEAI